MKKNKGFTLIELLVVIAIIGILSSVVLASLNKARGKGANGAVKSNLNNIRAQAELVYSNNNPNSYTSATAGKSVCDDPNVLKGVNAAASAGGSTVGAVNNANTAATGTVCYQAGNYWVIQSTLKATENGWTLWCVDNSGTARGNTALTSANATVCPTT